MTPAEKEKIITENRPFIRQHVKQKFPKFMKNYDELCSAAEAAVWLELEKYLPEKGTITTFMSSRIRHGASTYIAKNIFNVSNYYLNCKVKFHPSVEFNPANHPAFKCGI